METIRFTNITNYDGEKRKTEIVKQYTDDDLTIWEIRDVFSEFLRGCGYSEGSINEILNLD